MLRLKILILTLALLLGCRSYSPKPLIPKRSFEIAEQSRNDLLDQHFKAQTPQDTNSNSNRHFTFLEATALLSENSPSLKQANAEYKKAYKLAEIDTPLPNPELEVGTLIGSNLGSESSKRIQPLVAFGFTIPLGSRLSREDEVNSVMAKYAYLKFLLQHREEYLKLRKYYIEWILLEEQRKVYQTIFSSIQTSTEVTKSLIEAGVATALDLGIIELELLEKQNQLAQLTGKITTIKGQLSQILGVNSQLFTLPQSLNTPELPTQVLSLAKLKSIMLENNSNLALLQATYEIAEKELHLEISKQTPDITLSPSFEGDPGDDKKVWGLSVRFPIPLFDQNQRAIVAKENARELVKVQYEGALNNALALLETSHRHYQQQQQIFQQIENSVLKKAETNVAIALETLRRGEVDFFKYIDSERSLRGVLLEFHAAKVSMYKALLKMEVVMGIPIWLLPEEQEESIPAIKPNTPR